MTFFNSEAEENTIVIRYGRIVDIQIIDVRLSSSGYGTEETECIQPSVQRKYVCHYNHVSSMNKLCQHPSFGELLTIPTLDWNRVCIFRDSVICATQTNQYRALQMYKHEMEYYVCTCICWQAREKDFDLHMDMSVWSVHQDIFMHWPDSPAYEYAGDRNSSEMLSMRTCLVCWLKQCVQQGKRIWTIKNSGNRTDGNMDSWIDQ